MAYFEGTISEFTKFVGAYARLKVAFLAAKYKKQVGKCEDCGSQTGLDAAHVKGKERPLLIANILSEFIEDDIIKIDLNEFEQRFVEVHLPIESTIRVLCKECHRKYDRGMKEKKSAPKKVIMDDENNAIENLIKNQMNKSKAMRIAYNNHLSSLTNANTIFSNIILVQDGWWLQPFNDKFENDLYMILNDDRAKKLYMFRLPAKTITNPSAHFKQRNDKYRSNCSDIYIPTSGTGFKEKNGFDFSKFLIATIPYKES
jgi:hypothetical protein